MIDNYEEFLKRRNKAFEERDFNVLCKSAIECAECFHTKNTVLEAAFFLGRAQDSSGFQDLLEKIKETRIFYSPFNNPFITFTEEHRFYEMGFKYPWLSDEELDYLEKLYLSSDTYPMINRMLFDKELLRRELRHFNNELYDTKNEIFTDALCTEVFIAFLKNEVELNVNEALEERMQTFENKRVLGTFFGYETENKYPPIFVYNRLSNSVLLDTTTQLKDVYIFPITNFGKLSRASELFCDAFSGHNTLKDKISQRFMEKFMLRSIEYAALCAPWYLFMEQYVCEIFNVSISSRGVQYVRNQLSKEWLEGINNRNLR